MTEKENPITALKKLKYLLTTGKISYDAAKEFAEPHIQAFNKISAKRAKEAGLTPKKISFVGFMR